MRLPKRLQDAVTLARWSQREGHEVWKAAQLIALAHKASSAATSYLNGPGTHTRYNATRKAFEKAADEMGYSTEWNGLWPSLKRLTARCTACQDRPGKDGLGRPCVKCSGSGMMPHPEPADAHLPMI